MANRVSHSSTSKLNDHTAFLDSLDASSPSSSASDESIGLGFGVGVAVGLAATLSLTRSLLPLASSLFQPAATSSVASVSSSTLATAVSAANWTASPLFPARLLVPTVSSPSSLLSFAVLPRLASLSTPTLPQLLLLSLLLLSAYLYHICTRPLIFQKPLTPEARAAALRKSYADMPPPYPNAWFKLGDVMDVEGGKTLRVKALGRDFTAGRLPSGELWCEDSDGRMWETCEVNQVVFVWHDEMRRSSAWQIPVVSPDMARWRFVGRTEHEIVCHIQEIPENGADTAHLDFLHGGFVLDFLTAAKHTWDASWIPQPHPQQHIAKIAIDTQISLFGHKLAFTTVQTRITQVGPGIVQLMFPTPFGKVVLQETITPIHSNVQRASHVLWCEPSVPRIVAKAIMKSTLIQFERDFIVWNSKRWIRAPLAVKEDGPLLKYRRWVKQFFDRDGGALVRDFDGKEEMVERSRNE